MSKIVFFSDLHYAPELPVNNGSRIERKLIWYAEPMLEEMAKRICKNGTVEGFIDLNKEDIINIFKECL